MIHPGCIVPLTGIGLEEQLTAPSSQVRRAALPDEEPGDAPLRLLLAGVAFAAGLTGLFLLVWPGSTGRYFSWVLDPPLLASLIGGSYVASLFVFGAALRRPWSEVRGLVAGTLALTIPMLSVTFFHLEVFDFGRWQAWAWVLLFVASPLSFGTILWLRRGSPFADDGPLPPAYRIISGLLAAVFSVVAIGLWWDPVETARVLPFELPSFGGRVLGCWSSFLAFLGGWAAIRARAKEVQVPLLGIAWFMAGAIGGALRNFGDLGPTGRRAAYLLVLGTLLILSLASWRAAKVSASRL